MGDVMGSHLRGPTHPTGTQTLGVALSLTQVYPGRSFPCGVSSNAPVMPSCSHDL